MNYSAVIFDMDGLLLDSEHLWLACWIQAAQDEGSDEAVAAECAKRSIGATKERTRQIFEEAMGEGFSYNNYLETAQKRFDEAEKAGRLVLKPGAEEILLFLRDRHVKTALATSTTKPVAERQMRERGLLELFDICAYGEEVEHSKPAPDIFLHAARLLEAAPEECLVLEDSFNGIRAAHAAGMHSIMVPDVLQPDEEIRKLTDAVLPDLASVQKWLEGQGR